MSHLAYNVRSERDPKVLRTGPGSLSSSDRAARALGWLSIGLGVLEMLQAPRIARSLGMQGQEHLIRAFGAREIGSGILSLSLEKHAGLWSRVAGDGLDAAALMTAMRPGNPMRGNVALALGVVAGVAVLDVLTAAATGARHSRADRPVPDYLGRSGFPGGVEAARGLARKEVEKPAGPRTTALSDASGHG